MKRAIVKRLIIIHLIILLIFLVNRYQLLSYLDLAFIKNNHQNFVDFYQNNMMLSIVIYMAIYILATALSLPGAAILTLLGGALFGLLYGTVIVSFASTIGATLGFLVSRFLLRDYVQGKFGEKLKTINEGVEKEGAFYLFTLRLIPIFPFFLINLVMGLTPIKIGTFFVVSQVGMLLGTIAYVNAGVQLGQVDSINGIISLPVMLSFAILGLIPLVAKKIIAFIKRRRVYNRFSRPSNFEYNMVVIGAGSAGLVTSYICATLKSKVALIEKEKMGGDCLNTGCVPSKAIIKTAKILHQAKNSAKYGVKAMDVDFDFAEAMERVQSVISKVEPHDSIERYSELGVECITGVAKIISPWEVKVGDRILTTKNITIATGAAPRVPQIKGLEQIDYLTSDSLWNLRKQPRKFLVIGGGPIGCEMAQAFSRMGSEVTMITRGPRIMDREDDEVAKLIIDKFQEEGIILLNGHSPKEFLVGNPYHKLICQTDEGEVEVEFDQVLLAIGRVANIKGFGLEELNVEIRGNGTIEANHFLQTIYPNIYVCGDVTGPFQLTHMAAHQAWYCAVNGLLGRLKRFKVDYRVVPWATYTDPEVATVGLTEKMAIQEDIPYEVTRYGIDDLDRAIADGSDYGLVKVLTVPGKDKIIGATIVANNGSDLLLEFISGMKHGFGLNKILGTTHSYPSMGEANKYLAGEWKKARKPEKLLNFVKKFHRWERGERKR